MTVLNWPIEIRPTSKTVLLTDGNIFVFNSSSWYLIFKPFETLFVPRSWRESSTKHKRAQRLCRCSSIVKTPRQFVNSLTRLPHGFPRHASIELVVISFMIFFVFVFFCFCKHSACSGIENHFRHCIYRATEVER